MGTQIVIKNGFVFDPTSGVKGDRMDIFVENGKIVERPGKISNEINASGMIVMAGGVDIHSPS